MYGQVHARDGRPPVVYRLARFFAPAPVCGQEIKALLPARSCDTNASIGNSVETCMQQDPSHPSDHTPCRLSSKADLVSASISYSCGPLRIEQLWSASLIVHVQDHGAVAVLESPRQASSPPSSASSPRPPRGRGRLLAGHSNRSCCHFNQSTLRFVWCVYANQESCPTASTIQGLWQPEN